MTTTVLWKERFCSSAYIIAGKAANTLEAEFLFYNTTKLWCDIVSTEFLPVFCAHDCCEIWSLFYTC